jgi:hypothetical protein
MTNALEILKKLHLAQLQQRCPNVPDYALPRPTYNDSTANGLTRSIIDFIKLRGGQAERISSEGRIIDQRKAVPDAMGNVRVIGSIKRVRASSQVGTADISATVKDANGIGRSVKIEVKNKHTHDRQSEAQKAYQKQVEAAGGIYYIARDFQSFYDWYNSNFEKQ